MTRKRLFKQGGRKPFRSSPDSTLPEKKEKESVEGRDSEQDLEQKLSRIRQEFGDSPDLIIRRLKIGQQYTRQTALVYLTEMVDQTIISEFITGSLVKIQGDEPKESEDPEAWITFLLDRVLMSGETSTISEWNDLLLSILTGHTLLLLDGCATVIAISSQGEEKRSISEPTSQLVVRGPKDSFVESMMTNVSLIRRRLRTPALRLETMKIGKVSHTSVALMYIQGIAKDRLLEEVRTRLASIDVEAILESAYIEEFIQDHTFTPFPTVYNTERPDVAVGNLLEGRVVLIIDGTPFVLIAPTVFPQFFQSAEDYAQRFDISILMRLVRYMSFIVLILGPATYIALTTFHYEMIPTQLLISLMAQREGVPFPAFVEAILMELAFEILREAGVRMPRAIGQTVSIVGALILGQAVVEAGIITPVMVIVVALTGIASFALPAYNLSIAGRLIRFAFMLLAGLFGFYGITLGLIVLVAHLNSLRSFGMPYLAPLSPFVLRSQKDAVFKFPFWILGFGQNDRDAGQNPAAEELKAENKLEVEPPAKEEGEAGRWGDVVHKVPDDSQPESSSNPNSEGT